ncbi:MAG: hypothetical protein NZM40_10585 [Sphingomonadaceae bacterium]|nr:hypothetical protein [Sphingomonadaceae bacterium]MDW8414930.1 hypothetical protein [Thermaurantiacus sp.]
MAAILPVLAGADLADGLRLGVSQADLAAIAAIGRTTLAEARRQLERLGLVETRYRGLDIRYAAGLVALGDGEKLAGDRAGALALIRQAPPWPARGRRRQVQQTSRAQARPRRDRGGPTGSPRKIPRNIYVFSRMRHWLTFRKILLLPAGSFLETA